MAEGKIFSQNANYFLAAAGHLGALRRIPARRPSLPDLIKEFGKALKLTAKPAHIGQVVGIVKRFVWRYAIADVRKITTQQIQDHLFRLFEEGKRTSTIRNHFWAMSRFCRFLQQRRILAGSPTEGIDLPPTVKHLPRFLDQTEYNQVIRLAHEHGIIAEVGLALLTGLRMGELRRLRWADVDIVAKALYVIESKSRRPRVVWLNRRAKMLLRWQRRRTGTRDYVFPGWDRSRQFRNKPRCIGWWQKALGPIIEAIPKFKEAPSQAPGRRWHLFRHTFASRAVQAGVPIFKVSQWLGHSDVRTTQIYAHLAPSWDADIEKA